MLNLFDLMLLMLCGLVGMLFWQLRQISEGAEFHARRLCQQRRLQMLNVARVQARLGRIPGQGIGWKTRYQVEFSTDGLNSLKAELEFLGNRLKDTQMPFYPEPEWQQAPQSRGRVGMGSCGGGSCAPKKNCGTGCR
ncbi:DUF3301 domain-containing protein [Ferrimonas marina]|uniref:DUF3301 domain-containing protein n=1 Tax=Ferrimonas marina TaxID=299255 RepID=A0A1M5YHD5_9GAMM|nr:DUF3301 domain-containing protein [Ferrimonas marina]SHI10903.1 Protein of unknown function [Ferrimonas marina]